MYDKQYRIVLTLALICTIEWIPWFNSLPNDSFRLVHIESICRQQNKSKLKKEILLGMGSKHCRKRRKCWSSVFSPSPIMFSKGFFFRVVESWDCVVKGWWPGHRKNTLKTIWIPALFTFLDSKSITLATFNIGKCFWFWKVWNCLVL